MPGIRFILDENVHAGIADLLHAQQHIVWGVKGVWGEGTDDPDIIAYALERYAVVITRNHKHFHPRALRVLESDHSNHRHWGLLSLRCDARFELHRMRQLLSIIEHEYEMARQRYPDGLMLHMEIHDRFYIVHF